MKNTSYVLEGFAPQNVLRHFEDICAIPHGTYHEAALGAHILSLAERNALPVRQDAAGNILVNVPAAPGCEQAAPLLVQGHMDMVCVKEDDVDIDMEREGLHLIVEGNILRADRTSLGADNAVALCHMMALMEPHDFPHPPLELLFTVEEETGLTGIQKFDLSWLKARKMINMDCGDPDVLVVGASGGQRFSMQRPCAVMAAEGSAIAVEISGLKGGHSGLEIGKNRGNAIEMGGRVLAALCSVMPTALGEMYVRGNRNIPAHIYLSVTVPCDRAAEAKEIIGRMDGCFREELEQVDPGYTMTVTDVVLTQTATVEDTQALADLLLLLPHDAIRRDSNDPGCVLSSALLVDAKYSDGVFFGYFPMRYSLQAYHKAMVARLEAMCRLCGAVLKRENQGSPPWVKAETSALRDICVQVYAQMYGEPMKVEVENGGVEPSIVTNRMPDMDAVGFAPKSRGAHTTKEHLYLDTMEPFWNYFKAVLAALC